MDRLLWILSSFSSRLLVLILGVCDVLAIGLIGEKEPNFFAGWGSRGWLIVTIGVILIVLCVICGIIGGKIGYENVELTRSRQWHYRSNRLEGKTDRFRNTLYWAGKFACYPLIVAMLIPIICGIVVYVRSL